MISTEEAFEGGGIGLMFFKIPGKYVVRKKKSRSIIVNLSCLLQKFSMKEPDSVETATLHVFVDIHWK